MREVIVNHVNQSVNFLIQEENALYKIIYKIDCRKSILQIKPIG